MIVEVIESAAFENIGLHFLDSVFFAHEVDYTDPVVHQFPAVTEGSAVIVLAFERTVSGVVKPADVKMNAVIGVAAEDWQGASCGQGDGRVEAGAVFARGNVRR